MIYNLEKLYQYVGIDPLHKDCGCCDNNYCKLKSSTMYGNRCLPGYMDIRKEKVPIAYYPNLVRLTDAQYLAISDVVYEVDSLSIQLIPQDNGIKSYKFMLRDITVEYTQKEVALLQLVEKMFEIQWFNEEQKTSLFYIISYLETDSEDD